MIDGHKQPLRMATAAWMEIIATGQAYQAAIIRDDHAEAEALRVKGHDLLDSYFDLSGEAAHATKQLLTR